MKAVIVWLVLVMVMVTGHARPVKWQGQRIKKSFFLQLYEAQKDDLYMFNTQVISIREWDPDYQKVLNVPIKGAYGIFTFKQLRPMKDKITPHSLHVPSMIARCYSPGGGSYIACVEWWTEIIGFDGNSTKREAVGVYVGTMSYKGKRIPIIKCCPRITRKRFKQYLYELDDKRFAEEQTKSLVTK